MRRLTRMIPMRWTRMKDDEVDKDNNDDEVDKDDKVNKMMRWKRTMR